MANHSDPESCKNNWNPGKAKGTQATITGIDGKIKE